MEVGGPLPEPPICEVFSKKLVGVDRKPLERWFDGRYIETDNRIEKEYRNSRKPKREREDVESAGTSSGEIDALLWKAEASV